jgi:hypothetical protein
MKKPIKKTSLEWIKTIKYEIIDPDGWDRTNYDHSFYKEKITIDEFQRRVSKSTIKLK